MIRLKSQKEIEGIRESVRLLAWTLRELQPIVVEGTTTREMDAFAKSWIEGHIPPGSTIVMDSGKYYLGAFGPPLDLGRSTLEHLAARGDAAATTANLTTRDGTRRSAYAGEATYFREQLRVVPDRPGYEILQVLHDPGSPRADVLSLDEYKALGARFAVVSSFAWDQYVAVADSPNAAKIARYCEFYQSLRIRTTLVEEFKPSADVAGPTLRIYRIS